MNPGMTTSKAEFSFRVWVHPEDGDSADIEVWYQGLESTEPDKRTVTDWVTESFSYEDFHRLFDLDTDKHWQVVGKGVLQVMYSLGEYDEEISIVEFSKVEVIECRQSARTRFPVVQREEVSPKVSIEFLQSVYNQMEFMWNDGDWGIDNESLDQAIKDGREPVIAQLRELISTGTSPQNENRSPTISEPCNLDVENGERARALHRVVRAMHDGHCPKCGCLESADQFMRSLCHVCPSCGFTISIDEASLALSEFRSYLQRSVEVFEKWRDELNNKKGNEQ